MEVERLYKQRQEQAERARIEQEVLRQAIDHVNPHCLNGSSDIGNLQTLCKRCNSAKGTADVTNASPHKFYNKYWYPKMERRLAQRLVQTLLRRGYTYEFIMDKTLTPRVSLTKLIKYGEASFKTMKAIEKLSLEVMPELRVLAIFLNEGEASNEL